MPSRNITRRSAAILVASLPVGRFAFAAREGVEIRFVIKREQRQPSGAIAERRFENAMLMASGETMEVDFRDEYRIRMTTTIAGASANVKLQVWDNHETGTRADAGQAMTSVPLDGETTLTLLKSDNVHYPIVLKATRRALSTR